MLCAIGCFLAAGTVYSAPACCDKVNGAQLRFAAALYEKGWGGDDKALDEAIQVLERLEASVAATPMARAYYGSACIARARMVPDRQKPRWLRRGAAELDAAVRAAPEDPHVRLLRAVTFAVLPRLAGRMETVQEDYNRLVAGTRQDQGMEAGCRQAVLYHAGAFAMRNRDPAAVELLKRASAIESAGGIEPARLSRMLQLAREQFPGEDE